jgi:hypothetical protein
VLNPSCLALSSAARLPAAKSGEASRGRSSRAARSVAALSFAYRWPVSIQAESATDLSANSRSRRASAARWRAASLLGPPHPADLADRHPPPADAPEQGSARSRRAPASRRSRA